MEHRFSWQAVAEALIRRHGLHEGHWRVALQAGTPGGFNAQMEGGLTIPSVWVPLMGVVLVEEPEPTGLTADASKVNPRVPLIVTPPRDVVN